jgi:TonB family protein
MLFKHFFVLFLFINGSLFAQFPPLTPEYEAQAFGGKEQIEQLLQTQLNLPKEYVNAGFNAEVICYFNVDSASKVVRLKFQEGADRLLYNEAMRILPMIRFRNTLDQLYEPNPYFLILKLSSEKYKKYQKQKTKYAVKNNLPADSSNIIYAKADKSPEYYKNGDEGLNEFFVTEMEYPKGAIDKSIQGTVIIDFVVETNGFVTNIIIKQGVSGGCTEEALKLIKQTKWEPAVNKGKRVRYKTTYPITFSLNRKDAVQAIGQ